MARHPAEVLCEALALPVEARAALLDSLIESMDPTVDPDAAEALRNEIQERLQQIDSVAVELLPWETAQDRLRLRLKR